MGLKKISNNVDKLNQSHNTTNHTLLNMFLLVFKITPLTSIIKIFFVLIHALIPTYSVIVIAKCVNDAPKIINLDDPKLIF